MPLDFERITLNAIPDGEIPVFHASQFESMRPFIADLKWGTEDFAPGEDNWCTLSIRKNDDTLVIIDDIDIDNNTVSCILTQQSVACMGDNFCQLKVWGTEADEDGCIACLNFILHVQPDPEAGGITSESEINNLTQQIDTIAQEVIGNDYYNKTEVDGLISGVESQIPTKTSDLLNDSGYITSSDLTPYAKTADLATVATTGDYDDLLNKPTIPDAQIQSDWDQTDNTKVDYIKNKPDIDAMIDAALLAVMPVGTESGPIATFDTEIAAPLVNVSCNVLATGGNGTPDNPIPIVGYSEANITANGDTVTIDFGQTVYGGVLDVTRGKLTVTHAKKTFTGASAEQWYTYHGGTPEYYQYTTPISDSKNTQNAVTNMFELITAGERGTANGLVIDTDKNFRFALLPSENITDEATWRTFLSNNNLEICYELATPFDIDLTPEVISAIVGTNNVYTDTNGDTTVKFKDTIQNYIDKKVST